MRINKHDTNGTKPLLGKGELGYDDYTAGGDTGRVYVGNGASNIALAKKSEVDAKVVANAGITAGTATKVTYDAKGLVISGTNPTTIGGYGITDAYTKTETNTQISTAVNGLVDAAPGTLDTLNELAAALGDDPNFATTTANNIANKVDKVTSTDNAVVRFNGTTGEVQNSGVSINDKNWLNIGGYRDAYLDILASTIVLSENIFRAGILDLTNGLAITKDSVANMTLTYSNQSSGNTFVINSAGNVGIGVTPSAWSTINTKVIDFHTNGAIGIVNGGLNIKHNNYYNGTNDVYKTNGFATNYLQNSGNHYWYTAPSGTAGNPITWTNAMTLGASGNLVVGGNFEQGRLAVYSTNTTNGEVISIFGNSSGAGTIKFMNTDGADYGNTALAGIGVNKNLSTGRSINAAGTINTSGADYAEYEYSNDITVTKGQIVGFKAEGTLTDRYNESVRFAIKSTNPSIVGGDTWGNEDIVGKRPEQPVRKLDKTEQVKIEDSDEFETVVIEAGDTDAEWEAIEAKYKEDLADFEARLEVERQKVDRIAYAGKVPVNVYGATAGQYIVAIDKDGGIDGVAVNKADMTFAQYQDAVGRVNKILEDGRAEVAVIIH